MKQPITSSNAPKPGGAYSSALRVGDFVFISGQGPMDPASGEIVGQTIEEQTDRVLNSIEALFREAGMTMADVVKCTVHLSDINNFMRFNEVYARHFPDPKPTRTTVQSVLWPGLLVEIDAMAYRPGSGGE